MLDIEHLTRCALELADEIEPYCGVGDPGRMDWQYLFDLARRLKTQIASSGVKLSEVNILELSPVVDAFCLQILALEKYWQLVDFSDAEECWERFLDGWFKVRHLEGESPLQRAHRIAKEWPIELKYDFGSDRVRELASTAYYLQLINGDRAILLPVKLVGELFGVKPIDGSRTRGLLEQIGLIVKTKPYVRSQRADEFRFALDRTDLYASRE